MKTIRGYIQLITIMLISLPIFGQDSDIKSEIIVQFADNVFEMPNNNSAIQSIDQLSKIDSTLEKTLKGINFNKIFRTIETEKSRVLSGISQTGKEIQFHDVSNIYTFRINGNVEKAIERLKKNPKVLFAEKNFIVKPHSVNTNDNYFPSQWAITDDIRGIDADNAWNITKGSSNTVIGVLDSGVESWHQDIGTKLISPNQGSNNNINNNWYSHGFSVAGIAAAISNNNYGIAGIDWYAKIYSRRVDGASTSGQYNAIMNMVNNGVDIINMSYGNQDDYSTTVRKALTNAYNMNITLVASMGNENHGNINYPAGYDFVISVGATNFNRERYTESRNNIIFGSNWGAHIDVVAPGQAIAPKKNGDGPGFNNDLFFRTFTFTSAAAPQVSGIASLLLSVRSDLFNDDIKNLIQLSAKPVPDMLVNQVEWTQKYGHGLANAYEAVKRLQNPYILTHHTVSSGTDVGNTGYYTNLYGVSGIPDGFYYVQRHEVNKVITYPYMSDPNVWCRGADENGYSKDNPNFGRGWCEPKYVANDIAELRTYVYKVYDPFEGHSLGWYPSSPNAVKFSYTVHGIQTTEPFTAQILGPANVQTGQNGQWYASASGGQTPYYYSWQRSTSSSNGPWTLVGSGSSYSQIVNSDIWLKLTATESCGGGICPTASAVHFVSSTGTPLKELPIEQSKFVPEEFDLIGNFPNPFNPTTTISYDISEQSDVLLEVFNLYGGKVATLVNTNQSEGSYTANFNARNMATGIYIARLSANSESGNRFQKTIKMLLVK